MGIPLDVLTANIRDYRASDFNCIVSQWIKSHRDCGTTKIHDGELRRRITSLLQDQSRFRVSCDPEDDDQILGWVCADAPVLHYLYVKQPFRRQGIARQLLAAANLASITEILCTHWTQDADKISGNHPGQLRRII